MPRGANQKFKLYYLAKIMLEKTDEDHYLTMPQILKELERYEVTAERKSIYTDLKDLERLGIEVEGEPDGRSYRYHVVGRQFELPEMKLLVDAIQSSKFITARKSRELIKKLESFVSEYEARKLQRQVYVSGRIKTMNESIYYNIDAIYNAIAENRKIRFHYYQWNTKKEMELRRGGEYYCVSPWALSWDAENYYLIGYDSAAEKIKHYRVDKMLHIQMTEEKREGGETYKKLDMAVYSKRSFGMFGGKEEKVRLQVRSDLAGVMIDRFGKEIMMIPKDKESVTVVVDVNVSSQFFGWIFALGDGVKILGPEWVKEEMKKEIWKVAERYGGSEDHAQTTQA